LVLLVLLLVLMTWSFVCGGSSRGGVAAPLRRLIEGNHESNRHADECRHHAVAEDLKHRTEEKNNLN
jgi:hypothetical protein